MRYRSSCSRNLHARRHGFTLVETLVAVFIFVLVSVTFYRSFTIVMQGVRMLRIKGTVSYLANEQYEIIRNMPYADIGIVGGLPNGVIPYQQVLSRDGLELTVTTTIRNVDLPQDGTIAGTPNDTSPADAKLVELEISCDGCGLVAPLVYSTQVSPKNLESTGNNGALFISVINSSGSPVEDADVAIETVTGTTSININDSTGALGMLQLVDVPPLVNGYRITVTKAGYSTERTYPIATTTPGKPDATVATGQVTNVTFVIDQYAGLELATKTMTCSPESDFDFTLRGAKESGGIPNYSIDHQTDGDGTVSISNLEWDTYMIDSIDSSHMIVGTNPIVPVAINPGVTLSMDVIVAPQDYPALHVAVVDPTGLPISDAEVTLEFAMGTTKVETTGRGSTSQTDWSGGGGQEEIGDIGKYYSSNGNVAVLSPIGELRLTGSTPNYSSSGELESSTFDLGTTSQYHTISWLPGSHLAETGPNSVKFRMASNDELTPTSTWDYYGPNGTPWDYYTTSGESIASIHDGARYIRYKAYLTTASTSFTPSISDVAFTYTTGCVPPGQVLFTNMNTGSAIITVRKAGYVDTTQAITVGPDWQSETIVISN